MSTPCSLATRARAIHRVTGPNARRFLCALRMTSLLARAELSAIITIKPGMEPSARSGGRLLGVGSEILGMGLGLSGASVTGSRTVGVIGDSLSTGISSSLRREGRQPNGGRDRSTPIGGDILPSDSVSQPLSMSTVTTSLASSGVNHWSSNDHMRDSSPLVVTPPDSPSRLMCRRWHTSDRYSSTMSLAVLSEGRRLMLASLAPSMQALHSRGTAICAGRVGMARDYVARDPRTWKTISSSRPNTDVDIRAMLPPAGAWQMIPVHEILPLARGDSDGLQLTRELGGGFARRVDAIQALHRVMQSQVDDAHGVLLEALDDDDAGIRTAALRILPVFAIKRHDGLLQCLSDRLLDEDAEVERAARDCLLKAAPVFPSGCEEILRRELRNQSRDRRGNAFEALRLTAQSWPEAGCLHLDELIREEDADLRRRGSRILRTIASNAGATGWDLIGWSLEDEDAQVRRNASGTLVTLANNEPAIATIFIEAAMLDEDAGVRKSVIRALKKLDMQSPRVNKMVVDGARSRDYNLRKACIDHLPIIMSGGALREAASELLRQETRSDLRKKLGSLSRDVEIDGTEDEKNRFLAPVDRVEPLIDEVDAPRSGDPLGKGEHDKQRSGRPHTEERA